MPSIPRVVRWLLRLAAGPSYRDVVADLEEEAAARASTESRAALRRWIRAQVMGSIGPLVGRRLEMLLTALKGMHMKAWRGFGSDLSVALRRLRDAPGFSLVCIVTLALGIGGNAAVFTLIDRVLLKPLPVARPSELYRVGNTDACCVTSGRQGSFSLFSYDLYIHLREAAPEFGPLAAFQANTRTITLGRPDLGTPPLWIGSSRG